MTIVAENALAGHDRTNWLDIPAGSSEQIPAFPKSTYFEPGQTAEICAQYNSAFTAEIFRLGDYSGAGARRVTTVTGTPVVQPVGTVIANSGNAEHYPNWIANVQWAVPSDAEPGWYYALLVNTGRTQFNGVLFCVTDKLAKKSIVIVTGDATWHAAYNGFGTNNVYGASKSIGDITTRAFCSSYDKPVITRDYVPQTHFLNNTYPYLKWSERMGYEAGYTTIEQINNDPTILDGRDLIIWTGHNEYISQTVMDKTKSLIAAGQKMVNIAGNDFFWKVRFGDTTFPTSDASTGRVMWCRKDSMAGPSGHIAGVPFSTAEDWTGTWQDTRWSLREPSEDFLGDQFIANGIRNDAVLVPASMKSSPAWRDCPGIQNLADGTSYSFAAGTLGMEWDRPMLANPNVRQVLFSSTEVDLIGNASDANGANYGVTSEDTIHGFAMVANGDARIANFNSDQWPWALDALHLRGNTAPNVNAMQMMLNVMSDLGALPNETRVTASGLVFPTAVADLDSAYGLGVPPDPEPVGDFVITKSDGTVLKPYLQDGTRLVPYRKP